MIFNPVIAGGASKAEYAISDATSYGFPASANAGDYVVSAEWGGPVSDITIQDSNGEKVPYLSTTSPPNAGIQTRAPSIYIYFVMPASDVTIAYA